MKNGFNILIIVCLMILPSFVMAGMNTYNVQSIKISGVVRDGNEPIPGVNVLVKGTTIGTVTDMDGAYSIEVPSSNSVLVFSFIGYNSEEYTVSGLSKLDVVLSPDIETLGEVVVVGAVLKRSDLTGAVANVGSQELSQIPTTSVVQAMTGRMTGVHIQNDAGVSGGASIKIRGNNSLQFGAEPIFVVDGLIMDGGFNLINPNDIESIDVLKDASATAIYGSRGANGVVIVTTKKGKKGEGRVTYDGWLGVQDFSKVMPRLNAQEIYDLRVDAFANAYMDDNPGANRQAYINSITNINDPASVFADYEYDTYNNGKSYNWLNDVTRKGLQQNHTVAFSKATDEGSYYISMNYTRNKGLMENSEYNRYSGRVNLDQNIKPWLKIGTNTTFARSRENYVDGSVFSTANAANPLYPINDEENFMFWSTNKNLDQYNPLRSLTIDGDGYQSRVLSSNFINIKATSKLNLRSSIQVDIMDRKDLWYTPRDIGQSERNSTDGTATQRNDHWLNWQWDNTATYNVLSGDHNLTALAGFSMQQNSWDYNQLTATGFATDDLSYKYVNGAYNRAQWQMGSDFARSSLMSFLGRVNYSYNEKYFATVTARYDGSSRFAEGNRWGLFPSVALGWNFAEEDFFQNLNLNFVNIAKLRASYGIAGNQNIPNFAYNTLYYSSYTNGSVAFNHNGRLGQPNIIWEKQKQLNLGLDFVFFNKGLNVTVDYFNTVNEDLLMIRTLSPTTGFRDALNNIGELTNKGIELGVNGTLINKSDFKWTLGGNISSARNEITKLYGKVDAIYNRGGWTGVEIQREGNFFLGESVNSIYVYKFDKIAQESDMDRIAAMDLGGRTVKPGDILPVDKNGDGVINDDDRFVVGRKDPKFYGGIFSDITFKNFTLNALFTYNYGAKRISYLYEGMMNSYGMSAAHKDVLNRWTPENTNTDVPRASSVGGRFAYSDVDLGVQDASFLRLSALTIAYNIPSAVLSKAKINNFRVYFTGNNLFVATKYKGYDPEGGDYYPMSRMFVTGVNIGF